MRTHFRVFWGGVSIASGITLGCRSPEEKAAPVCDPHLPETCEQACHAGVLGDGGCLSAGLAFEARAATDQGGKDGARAEAAYDSACEGDVKEACVALVSAIDRRLLQPGRLVVMNDADAKRRQDALVRACTFEPRWCTKLGHALLGVDARGAREALSKGCQADAKCRDEGSALATSAELLHTACVAKKPYACSRLAVIIVERDPPRAGRAYREECSQRRFVDLDTCERWRSRPDTARADALRKARELGMTGVVATSGNTAEKTEPYPPPRTGKGGRLRFGVTAVLTDSQREKLIAGSSEPLLECYRHALGKNPELQGRVAIRFTLDGLGYPYTLANDSSDLPDAGVVRCAMRALEEVEIGTSRSHVLLPLMFTPK